MGISTHSLTELQQIKHDLADERTAQEKTFKDIGFYVNPDMGDWEDSNDPAKNSDSPDTGRRRYDTTAEAASNLTADGVEGYAFGRSNAWFRLELETKNSGSPRGGEGNYLQRVERQLYRQLNRSPFYDEGRLYIRSLLDFGTALMFRVENVEHGIPIYRTMHLKRILIGANRYGDVDTTIRSFWLSPQDAAKEFGYESLPSEIKSAYDNNRTERWKFDHFIFPADKYDLDMDYPRGKEYVSVYVPDIEQMKDLKIGGYETKPFFCSRFSRSFEESAWGASAPGILQLSNIKQLNATVRDRRKTSQKLSDPPIKATEGMYGRIINTPGGITYVPPGQDYGYMPPNGTIQPEDMDVADLRRAINDAYHTEFFLILTQNIERIKTATEAQGLQGEKAAMLAAFFGRLGYEFLEPVLEDLFMMELNAGRLPPPPRELQGKTIQIDYVSPLYQMQKQYLNLTSTRQALSEIATIAKIQVEAGQDPDVLDTIDFDAYVKNVADTYNMNKDVLRDLADIQRIRQGRAKRKQAMMEFQMQQEQAKMENDRVKALASMAGQADKAKTLMQQQGGGQQT